MLFFKIDKVAVQICKGSDERDSISECLLYKKQAFDQKRLDANVNKISLDFFLPSVLLFHYLATV